VRVVDLHRPLVGVVTARALDADHAIHQYFLARAATVYVDTGGHRIAENIVEPAVGCRTTDHLTGTIGEAASHWGFNRVLSCPARTFQTLDSIE
jgi:hypothetical protein